MISDAGEVGEAETLSELEVRPQVDQEAPLRQQGSSSEEVTSQEGVKYTLSPTNGPQISVSGTLIVIKP